MIPGVQLIPLVTHNDERGFFREILKSNQIIKFGQWSMSYMVQDTIKAFHFHRLQYDYWFVPSGIIKAVLVDISETQDNNTSSYGDTEEYILGDNQPPQVLVIPPGVAHGLKVLQGPAVLMYLTSEPYNPQDEGRLGYNELGYDWFKRDIK